MPQQPAASSDGALARWDFSKTQTLSYEYTQHSKSDNDLDGMIDHSAMDVSGALELVSHGDGTANVVLRAPTVHILHDGGAQAMPAMPDMVVPGMHGDGALDDAARADPKLMTLLAPLSRHALRIGQSEDLPMSFPFNAGGSPLTVTGTAKITLRTTETTAGHTIAAFDVVYDVGKLPAVKELPGSYAASLIGTGAYRFDVTAHALVRAEFKMKMTMEMEMPGTKDGTKVSAVLETESVVTRR